MSSFIAFFHWLGEVQEEAKTYHLCIAFYLVVYDFDYYIEDIFFYTQKKQQRMNVVHNKFHICVNRLYPSKKAPDRSSLMTEDIDQVS